MSYKEDCYMYYGLPTEEECDSDEWRDVLDQLCGGCSSGEPCRRYAESASDMRDAYLDMKNS